MHCVDYLQSVRIRVENAYFACEDQVIRVDIIQLPCRHTLPLLKLLHSKTSKYLKFILITVAIKGFNPAHFVIEANQGCLLFWCDLA